MRAARIHAAGGPGALRVERIALPRAGRSQVLVRVHFAMRDFDHMSLLRVGDEWRIVVKSYEAYTL